VSRAISDWSLVKCRQCHALLLTGVTNRAACPWHRRRTDLSHARCAHDPIADLEPYRHSTSSRGPARPRPPGGYPGLSCTSRPIQPRSTLHYQESPINKYTQQTVRFTSPSQMVPAGDVASFKLATRTMPPTLSKNKTVSTPWAILFLSFSFPCVHAVMFSTSAVIFFKHLNKCPC